MRVGRKKEPNWNAEEVHGETKVTSSSPQFFLMLQMTCASPKKR